MNVQKVGTQITPSLRDAQTGGCSVLSSHLWLVPCRLCSHTCTYITNVSVTGENGHNKSTKRREGVWVVIQLLHWAHFKTEDRNTGAHKQQESSCIEKETIGFIPQWIFLTSSYMSNCHSMWWGWLSPQMTMDEMLTMSYAVHIWTTNRKKKKRRRRRKKKIH